MVKNIINCIEFCIKVMKQMVNFRQPELDTDTFRQDVIRDIQVEKNQEEFISRSGFTLAEMLVVIGIIGVVSSLTLPNLTQSTNEKETVVKLLKARSTIGEAYARAIATYGQPGTWVPRTETSADNGFKLFTNHIVDFLNIQKDCSLTTANTSDCWATTGNTVAQNSRSFILNDGTAIKIKNTGFSNTTMFSYNFPEIGFCVDVDGPKKGLNAEGEDVYCLGFDKTAKSVVSPGSGDFTTISNPSNTANWIIVNGNADFIGTTAGKCKNNKQLNWTTNTTCK